MRIPVLPLESKAFAPFGDVLAIGSEQEQRRINDGHTIRFHDLAQLTLNADGGRPTINIFRSTPLPRPLMLKMMERHPLSSQAFYPLGDSPWLVVVAPPGEWVKTRVRAFLARPDQGVNYHPGTWHHYSLALNTVSDFLVIDRAGPDAQHEAEKDCDEIRLPEDQWLALDFDKPLPPEFLPTFIIACSDSSFTNPHEVVSPEEPKNHAGEFTHIGARYWGFETPRHRATRLADDADAFLFDDNACHWIHLGLKQPSRVSRIAVSTRWFTGNHVPEISVELKFVGHDNFHEVIARTSLAPDQDQEFLIDKADLATECLVRCYHEGGIARINLFGEPGNLSATDQRRLNLPNLLETADISHISNAHYGKPADAVAGNRAVNFMFGWESARSGFGESALFHLARPAMINRIIVDTYLHRLNAPMSCHVYGLNEPDDIEHRIEAHLATAPRWAITFEDGLKVVPDHFQTYMAEKRYRQEPTDRAHTFRITLEPQPDSAWQPLVPFGRLRGDTWQVFNAIKHAGPVTHLLYLHYPNGGIHGLKVFGEPV